MGSLQGLSMGTLRDSGSSVLWNSIFNRSMSGVNLNSSISRASTAWKARGVCGVRANLLVQSSKGRRSPVYIHARDRVVDFGKSKGSMLGTLSSRYLRWMTKNLKGTQLHEWAEYAEEVLEDPLYLDRIEWEKVEKLLVQSHDLAQLSNNRDALAPARMYGWDIDNGAAWRGVNFALLGTTKGGKIPRKPMEKEPVTKPKPQAKAEPKKKATSTRISNEDSKWASTPVVEGGSLRDELDRRRQARREKLAAQRDALLAGSKSMKEIDSKFPGRGGLLSKLREKNSRQ